MPRTSGWGQRLAAIGIEVQQRGQSFEFGGGGGTSFAVIRFLPFTIRKTAKATMRKLRIVLARAP